jgi:hypothetical protein
MFVCMYVSSERAFVTLPGLHMRPNSSKRDLLVFKRDLLLFKRDLLSFIKRGLPWKNVRCGRAFVTLPGLITVLLDVCAYTCGVYTGTYVYECMCMYVCARVI